MIAGLLIVALATGCTHEPNRDARIVFESTRDGLSAIYSTDEDGTGLARVRTPRGRSFYGGTGYWSPGGERLLLTIERERGGEVVSIDLRTGTRTRIPIHDVRGASWSSDAEQIAVAAERGIVVADADGANRRQLTHDPFDSYPAWAPNGERIAFVSGDSLYTVSLRGERRLVLSVPDEDLFVPQWSHDGRWLAISRTDSDTSSAPVEVVQGDGTGRRRVARDADRAVWSPREDTLLYTRAGEISRVDADGRNRKRLTFGGRDWSFEREPTWSPDGMKIAYVARRFRAPIRDPLRPTDIWVMNADGSGKRAITDAFPTGGSNFTPVWLERAPKASPVHAPMRLVSFARPGVLRTRQPIGGLDARGTRAVVVEGLGSGTDFWNPPGPLRVWDAAARRVRGVPVRGCGTAFDPVLMTDHAAYVCDNSAVDLISRDIRTTSPGGKTTTVLSTRATHLRGVGFPSRLVLGLAGGPSAIAYATGERPEASSRGFDAAETQIWLLEGERPPRRLATLEGEARVVDVGDARIVVLYGQRAVAVVSRDGRIVRRLAFGRNDVRSARLDGPRLFVLLRDRVVVYDIASGRRRASWRWPSELGYGRLAGVAGDLGAYVVGMAIHLRRLSDGREVVVDLRTAAEPVHARLTHAGLFYSYSDPRSVPAGRAVFVARAELERALARAARR